ncbi:MAG: glycosyl hydrolase family 18 protein [Clostridia bacterium]|nr:hypothetical protein [Clostridium sp.]
MEKQNKKVKREKRVKRKLTAEEVNKKKKMITRIFIFIVVLIVLFGIAMFASDFIILDKNKTTNLIINNKNVTSNLKNDIYIEDGIIYLSKSDVANFFDKYIYEEKESNKIITTYDKKIAEIGFEDNVININGANKKIYAHAIEKNNTIYLPVSEMKEVYNIEVQNIEDTKVITMDSLNKEQKKAIVTSNVSIKSSTRMIAKTVDRIKKGSTVVVISSDKGFSKVRTENGKIGYIKTKKLANEYTVRENLEEEKQIEGKVNLTWDYYSETASAPDRTGTKIDGVNVVSPSFFYIDEKGRFVENVGDKGISYIEWAHENGYKVWPMVSNAPAASSSLEITSKIMNDYEIRQKLIDAIVKSCVEYDLDGINIDFENMKQEDKDMFSRFIIELVPRMKEIGLVTSVDVTAPDGGETWSMCFDRHVIGDVADYTIFMAYDQNGVSSNKAGTNAGYDWIKLNLTKFLKTEEIEPEKLILAVPFYTRLWTENPNGEIIKKSTVAMNKIENVIPDDVEKQWKDDVKQNYVEYKEGENTKKMWIEDVESLKAKMSLIKENNLAGVASWQKGMETDDVWEMMNNELNK